MKTVQRANEVKRFDDDIAERKVRNEGYNYVPKSVWKEIRDAEKEIVKKDSGRTAPPPIVRHEGAQRIPKKLKK